MPPQTTLIKPASATCSMTCDYCFYCDETKKRQIPSYGMMSDETLRNIIKKTVTSAEGSCSIAFQGGEPTLCGLPFFRKAVQYAEEFNRNRIRIDFSLQTNGFGITEEWCAFFKENAFLIGLSVDGTRELHDAHRHAAKDGAGTYDRVLQTAAMFDKYGVDYNILTVVHSGTAAKVREIYAEYKRRGWNWQQYIACLDPLGEERGQKPYSLQPKDYGNFLITLFDLWYRDLLNDEQPYIRQFENYIGILAGFMPESCEQRGTCGRMYVAEADGSAFPCDFYVLDEYRLGNFNENSLAEMDARREEIGFMERSRNHTEKCRRCRYGAVCRGGCYRSRENGLNDFCEGYYAFFEACIDRMIAIARAVR